MALGVVLICSVSCCDRKAGIRSGLCSAHLKRARKGQELDTPIRKVLIGVSNYERVMARVERVDACLVFMGARANGYGKVNNRSVHKIVWEHHYGDVPDKLLIRHTCDNRPCVEIEHLLLGTQRDNRRDAVERSRTATESRHGRAKLTEDQVLAIRANDRSGKVLARVYGVSDQTIYSIRNRTTWTHV